MAAIVELGCADTQLVACDFGGKAFLGPQRAQGLHHGQCGPPAQRLTQHIGVDQHQGNQAFARGLRGGGGMAADGLAGLSNSGACSRSRPERTSSSAW